MSKTATIQARINPELKTKVEAILATLGLTPSEAVNMFYSKIALEQGIPFDLKVPNAETRQAMHDARIGRDMQVFTNVDDVMKDLGSALAN